MSPDDEIIGAQQPRATPATLIALGGVVLSVAISVGVAALESAGLIEFDRVLQVSGFVSPMIASALGGVLYGRRAA